MTNEEYMQTAINLAQLAGLNDEVPIAALIVNPQTGEIIAQAANHSAHGGNATDHAEMAAIRQACDKLGATRLWDMDMYVTLEPCAMCAAAISFARIRNLYFGAIDEKGGAVVSGVKFYESPTCHHRPHVEYGICAEQCSALLKDFFRQKR